jgi:RNA polymerase sigma-70 factor (ECF subfamily)
METETAVGGEVRDDAALVREISGGLEPALGELYDRYAGLLFSLASRILGSSAEAEDAVQDTLVQVWRQAGRYDPRRSSVSTWLVLLTRSRCIDRLRSRNAGNRAVDRLEQETGVRHESPEGASAVWNRERRDRVQRELKELPAEQKEVLELAFYEGLSQSEIAARTGIPLGTVKTRTLLAMRKLRAALRQEIRELL